MAKRKHSENQSAKLHAHAPAVVETAEPRGADLSSEGLGGLADEVRAFIDRRDELASKLAQEIELTEKKLVELKRTAALLFPENAANGHGEKERQERKPKKVNLGKNARSQAEPTANESRTSNQTLHAEPAGSEGSQSDGAGSAGQVDANSNPS
jgi:hypothetical protein